MSIVFQIWIVIALSGLFMLVIHVVAHSFTQRGRMRRAEKKDEREHRKNLKQGLAELKHQINAIDSDIASLEDDETLGPGHRQRIEQELKESRGRLARLRDIVQNNEGFQP